VGDQVDDLSAGIQIDDHVGGDRRVLLVEEGEEGKEIASVHLVVEVKAFRFCDFGLDTHILTQHGHLLHLLHHLLVHLC